MTVITEEMEEETDLKELNTLFIIYLIYNIIWYITFQQKKQSQKSIKRQKKFLNENIPLIFNPAILTLISNSVKLCSIIATVDSTVYFICWTFISKINKEFVYTFL